MKNKIDPEKGGLSRRQFLKGSAVGVSVLAAMPILSACSGSNPSSSSAPAAAAATPLPSDKPKKDSYKMAFIQQQPHTVSTGWAEGISQVTDVQANVDFKQLDGQNSPATQISLMDTLISQGADVIFLQPADSVGLSPSVKKARDAGIPVITLNIGVTEPHAAHVEMNHYYGAIKIAEKMGEMMGGKGNVVILNAPPGLIIRDLRTNGFMEGLKKYPDIKVISDQSADWDRKKAQDILSAILASGKEVNGVYGVNDSMALGAVDVAKTENLIGKMVIWGNDGEKAAIESIEAGELNGTQYTDVWQQGRFAAALGIGLASGGITAFNFTNQGHILMPYSIVTKDNAGDILPFQRW